MGYFIISASVLYEHASFASSLLLDFEKSARFPSFGYDLYPIQFYLCIDLAHYSMRKCIYIFSRVKLRYSLKWPEVTFSPLWVEPLSMQAVGVGCFQGFFLRVECIRMWLLWTFQRICFGSVTSLSKRITFQQSITSLLKFEIITLHCVMHIM